MFMSFAAALRHRATRVRLAVGAVAATVALELALRLGAPMLFGVDPIYPAQMICRVFGYGPGSCWAGRIGHYGLGLLVFPLGYLALASLFRGMAYVVLGLAWGLVLWVVAMSFFVPMAGSEPFLGFGAATAASLFAHAIYGAVLAAVVGAPSPKAAAA